MTRVDLEGFGQLPWRTRHDPRRRGRGPAGSETEGPALAALGALRSVSAARA